jgi:hypothetical protein
MLLPWVTYKVAINYLQGQYSPCPQSCLNRFRYHTCKLYAIELAKVENAQAPTRGDNGQVVTVEPCLLGNPADSIVQALDLLDGSHVVKLNLDSVGLTPDLGTNFLGEFV